MIPKADDRSIERIDVSVFTFPTEQPEADGTLDWDSTTMILVEITAGGETGTGYTYAHAAAGAVVEQTLAPLLEGEPLVDHPALWHTMRRAIRNSGIDGIAAMAISAVDNALWDLRARVLGVSLVALLGAVRESIPVYGSGGFTSYDDATLVHQIGDWVAGGIRSVKMKVGRDAAADLRRVAAVRRAIGEHARLMVDANNAYGPREAVDQAHRFAENAAVTWLEQPIPQDDLAGMCFVRNHAPPGMEVTDGEYGYTPSWFLQRIEAGAADVLMPDMTRCLGMTGFLRIAALCEAGGIPISSHCAPSLHATAGCVVSNLRDCEYFHDHVRIEQAVFDGAPVADDQGRIAPSRDEPGFGLRFKRSDAERLSVHPFRMNRGRRIGGFLP